MKITFESVIARAISDCSESLKEAESSVEEYQRMGLTTNAVYFQDEIVKPLQEELDELKKLYQIGTGRPFDLGGEEC